MRTMNKAGRAIGVGLMTGVAGGALVMAASASAQSTTTEQCYRYSSTNFQCYDPATNDVDVVILNNARTGNSDGGYDNLENKIEASAPSEAEVEAATTNLEDATDTATALNAANDGVTATLTQDNLDAFADVDTAETDLATSQAAEAAASTSLADAQTAFNAAADDLTDANQAVTDAQVAVSDAQDAVDAAQAAYDANQTPANLAALNDALSDRADAQLALADAEDDRSDALAAANAASADLTSAQTVFDDAVDARIAAADDLTDALAALDTSLASNDDFVDAITDAGFTADAAGLTNLADAADAANTDLAVAQTNFDRLDDITNTYIRAQEVLTPAAENQNAAIAAASQALLGDPRANETDFEVETIAALVDHETRITANEATLVDHEDRITVNEATLVEHDERITANTVAIVAEAETRAAADTMLLETITSEQNARIAADNAMMAQINNLGGRVGVLESRMNDFDDRLASSTATAIALGGMGFLPDTTFNLAVSGGFYEGANAIAANAGFRVTENIAITAGVGGGLNKGGKVGGRVGVIFGW